MKHFLFQLKSNSYIPLCILLLLFFSPITLLAAEMPTVPIENVPLPTEEIPEEAPTTIPAPELPPEDIVVPDVPPISTEEPFSVEASNGTYYVTSSGGLNVRKGPSIQYDIIGTLPYGEEITITGKVDADWLEIPFQGMNGYISAKYVSTEPLMTLPFETEEVPNSPETIIEENEIEQDVKPFISDTTTLLLLLAIIAVIVIIIITVFSFFRNHHKHDYDFDEDNYDDTYYDDDDYDDKND